MARRVNMHLDEAFAAQIEAQKPRSLALAAYCALLIEQGLDRCITLEKPSLLQAAQPEGGEGFASTSTSNKEIDKQPLEVKQKTRARAKSPFDGRVVSADLVPADLLDCQQLLPEFWSVKKGVRSESVWNRVCGKLRAWTPEQRREALERAIASGWGDVFEPKVVSPAQAKGSVDAGAARLERMRENGWI